MARKRVLVTGGAGYIGSHTVVELYSAGYLPVIADNLSNSSLEVIEGIEKIVGEKPHFENIDCTNFEALQSLFAREPDLNYAIHFAAYKAVGESVEVPLFYFHNNLVSLINLATILQERESSSIVFSSSCTVYGQPDQNHLPVSEEAPLLPPSSPYGRSKRMCEEILLDTVNAPSSNLNVISLRYFNPIGAHPSALIGELPKGVPQNLLPFVTQTAAGLRKELSVYGDDYNTPDGSCIRDYIYVCDLAKAHVAAIKRLESKEEAGEIEYFNVGTGKGLSVFEIISLFESSNSLSLPYKIAPRRAGDVEQVWADPSKANKLLNWVADTPIEEVMRSAWRWEKRIRGIE